MSLTKEEYDKLERSQTAHRTINSLLSVIVLVLGYFFLQAQLKPLYEDISGITEQRVEREEIAQIFNDESLRLCQYKDSLGNATIGVGHLVLKRDNLPRCITSHKAIELLVEDYRYAKANVEKRYPWAEGEVKLILINMTFQLGENRLSKFTQTLEYLEEKKYQKAAGEVLDSVMYKQSPKRLERHSARILSLSNT
mgnify:CR=1 FL=1|tara:strand:+ start:88 stop:675 length:588 start_codon:yes stop_codon:yes gene_type:complete